MAVGCVVFQGLTCYVISCVLFGSGVSIEITSYHRKEGNRSVKIWEKRVVVLLKGCLMCRVTLLSRLDKL